VLNNNITTKALYKLLRNCEINPAWASSSYFVNNSTVQMLKY